MTNLDSKYQCPKGQYRITGSVAVLWLFLGLILLLPSCSTKQKLARQERLPELSKEDVIAIIQDQNVDYQHLAAKVKLSFENEMESGRATLHIRHVRDSVILINVKKLGIPLSKMFIRPDSVWITYRLESVYEKASNHQLRQAYGLNLDFESLQSFLVGNVPIPSLGQTDLVTDDDKYTLISLVDGARHTYEIDRYSGMLSAYQILDRDGNNVRTEMSSYEKISSGEMISMSRLYISELQYDNQKSTAKISISSIVLHEPKPITFNIPDSYEEL